MSVATAQRFDAALLDAMMTRLHDACLTMAVLSGDGPKGFPVTSMARQGWAQFQREWWDAGNEASMLSHADIARRLIAAPPFAATPKQVDDALPALLLLKGLTPEHFRVLRFRAHQLWYATHAYADEPGAFWRGGWRMIGSLFRYSAPSVDDDGKPVTVEKRRTGEWARTKHWQCVVTAYAASV